MTERYQVRLAGEGTGFAAAHFITYDGDICEPLHGHNFGVSVVVTGPLDENHYVVDFVALKKAVDQLLAELDHHVLLPTQHPKIKVDAGEHEIEVTYPGRRWVFPRHECVLLPVPNTTVELMARYLGKLLLGRLSADGAGGLLGVTVEVEESPGCSALYHYEPDIEAG